MTYSEGMMTRRSFAGMEGDVEVREQQQSQVVEEKK